MSIEEMTHSQDGLEEHGIENVGVLYWNLATSLLYEEAIRRREGYLAYLGRLVVRAAGRVG